MRGIELFGESPLPHGTIQEKIRELMGLHWLDCLSGWRAPGVAQPLSLHDQRVLALRNHRRFASSLRTDRIGRFWHRERRLSVVFSVLMLRSAVFNGGTTVPVTLQELAAISGLSAKTVQAAIERAAATGDLLKGRAQRDGRLLVLEPAPRLLMEAEQWRTEFMDMASAFIGRRNPLHDLSPTAQWESARLLLAMATTSFSAEKAQEYPQETRRSFFFLMLDLLVDGPQPQRGFVGIAARRLSVTPMTVRNVIGRARELGWLAAGTDLVPTDLARERFGFALATLECKWNLLFDVIETMARVRWREASTAAD